MLYGGPEFLFTQRLQAGNIQDPAKLTLFIVLRHCMAGKYRQHPALAIDNIGKALP